MRSDSLKKGITRAPARAMLKATGLNDADLDKPLQWQCTSSTIPKKYLPANCR